MTASSVTIRRAGSKEPSDSLNTAMVPALEQHEVVRFGWRGGAAPGTTRVQLRRMLVDLEWAGCEAIGSVSPIACSGRSSMTVSTLPNTAGTGGPVTAESSVRRCALSVPLVELRHVRCRSFRCTPVTQGLRVDLSKPDVTENDNTLPAGHLRITKGPRAPSRVGSSSGPSFGRAWNYDE